MNKRICDLEWGLALSGGGFRATLFNLGGLWRLNELGLLKRLDIISSVSGGSITAGVLGLAWRDLQFDDHGVATNYFKRVVAPLQSFCRLHVDVGSAIGGLISLFSSIGDHVARKYAAKLFHDATLQDLPDETLPKDDPNHGPRFNFYATSLQTGSSVRMCRKRLADYKLGEIPNPRVPLAKVVAASSAFPPALSPVVLKLRADDWKKLDGAYCYGIQALREKLYLTDGGVYDNMGLETIWDRCKTVLVSDAGAPFTVKASPPTGWLKQTLRVLGIITEQTRALRRRRLVDDFAHRAGAYWGIQTRIAGYAASPVLAKDNSLTAGLAKIRTRLNPFSDEEQGRLINWGYALADAAIRTYVIEDAPIGVLPMAGFSLDTNP